jgi:hypothetical protein
MFIQIKLSLAAEKFKNQLRRFLFSKSALNICFFDEKYRAPLARHLPACLG